MHKDEVVFTGQPGSIRMSVFPSNTLNQAIAYFLLSKPGTDPKAQNLMEANTKDEKKKKLGQTHQV